MMLDYTAMVFGQKPVPDDRIAVLLRKTSIQSNVCNCASLILITMRRIMIKLGYLIGPKHNWKRPRLSWVARNATILYLATTRFDSRM